ncbi:MAG: ribosomal-processing cysteine protease Prp [Leptospiraceae bacterium]|nr:ribosomal-processing cysteine protease Prp [Leptospiraceae bacterium]MCP5499707.1 ribosomal-processing cysteine protease Prp [Leptospiraceae bacterium]
MIEIQVEFRDLNYSSFQVSGHAPGQKGNNVLCSAVSALSQSLFFFLELKGRVKEKKIQEGFLYFSVFVEEVELVKNAFEQALCGLQNLEKQFPEEIQIYIKSYNTN